MRTKRFKLQQERLLHELEAERLLLFMTCLTMVLFVVSLKRSTQDLPGDYALVRLIVHTSTNVFSSPEELTR